MTSIRKFTLVRAVYDTIYFIFYIIYIVNNFLSCFSTTDRSSDSLSSSHSPLLSIEPSPWINRRRRASTFHEGDSRDESPSPRWRRRRGSSFHEIRSSIHEVSSNDEASESTAFPLPPPCTCPYFGDKTENIPTPRPTEVKIIPTQNLSEGKLNLDVEEPNRLPARIGQSLPITPILGDKLSPNFSPNNQNKLNSGLSPSSVVPSGSMYLTSNQLSPGFQNSGGIQYTGNQGITFSCGQSIQYHGGQDTQLSGSPGKQYTSSTGIQYTGNPGVQYTGNLGVQYTDNLGVQYTGNPGVQHTVSPSAQYSGSPSRQYTGSPGVQYTVSPGTQYSGNQGVEFSSGQYNNSIKFTSIQNSPNKLSNVQYTVNQPDNSTSTQQINPLIPNSTGIQHSLENSSLNIGTQRNQLPGFIHSNNCQLSTSSQNSLQPIGIMTPLRKSIISRSRAGSGDSTQNNIMVTWESPRRHRRGSSFGSTRTNLMGNSQRTPLLLRRSATLRQNGHGVSGLQDKKNPSSPCLTR